MSLSRQWRDVHSIAGHDAGGREDQRAIGREDVGDERSAELLKILASVVTLARTL